MTGEFRFNEEQKAIFASLVGSCEIQELEDLREVIHETVCRIEDAFEDNDSRWEFRGMKWDKDLMRHLARLAMDGIESGRLFVLCCLVILGLAKKYTHRAIGSEKLLEDDFFLSSYPGILVKPDFERIDEVLPAVFVCGEEPKNGVPFISAGVPLGGLVDALFEQLQSKRSSDYEFVVPVISGQSGKTYLCKKALCLICRMKLAPQRLAFQEKLKTARTLVLDIARYSLKKGEYLNSDLIAITQDAVYEQWGIRIDNKVRFADCIKALAKQGPIVLCLDGIGCRRRGTTKSISKLFVNACRTIGRIADVYLILTGWSGLAQEADMLGLNVRHLEIQRIVYPEALGEVLKVCLAQVGGVLSSIAHHTRRVENLEELYAYMLEVARGDRGALFTAVAGFGSSWLKGRHRLAIPLVAYYDEDPDDDFTSSSSMCWSD